MAYEPIAAAQFVYSKLAADVTMQGYFTANEVTRIKQGAKPKDWPFPVVLFQLGEPQPAMAQGNVKVMVAVPARVYVVNDSDDIDLIKAPAARIESVLHGASGSVTNGTVEACTWLAPYQRSGQLEGQQYLHLGADFLIHVPCP